MCRQAGSDKFRFEHSQVSKPQTGNVIDSHSHIIYNEMADQLAGKAHPIGCIAYYSEDLYMIQT